MKPKPRVVDIGAAYAPQPKQMEFHEAMRGDASACMMVGGAGSGKSVALLWEAVNWCLMYQGVQVLILRKSFQDLKKSFIENLHRMVPQELYRWNENDKIATFEKFDSSKPSSKIFFGYCKSGSEKDLAQYLSSEFPLIIVDEAGQFSFKAWQFLSTRNRVNTGCQPNPTTGCLPRPKMAGGTNPVGPGWAWIKSVFIDGKPPAGYDFLFDPKAYWWNHSTIYDNIEQQKRDPEYVKKLMAQPAEMRRKYLDGDINTVSGQYYSNFDESEHVVNLAEDPHRVEWQPWQPCWVGLDWGIAHHAAAFWCTRALVRMADGTRKMATVVYRELVVNETGIADIARLVAEMTDGRPGYRGDAGAEKAKLARVYVSHELFARRSDPSPDKTVAAELSRELQKWGLPGVGRASGSASHSERINGAVLIREDLDKKDLFILASCEQLVRAIPLLARDEDDLEDVAKTSGVEDDIFDGLKHAVLSERRDSLKPAEERLREQAAKIDDPMARWWYIREQRRKMEESPTFQPQFQPAWMRETGR